MSENDMTAAEYRDEIDATAEIILEELIDYGAYDVDQTLFEDELSEAVWETADGHSWMIYTGYHLDVLRHAEHEPDEWQMYVDLRESPSYREVIQAMAFDVFQSDLHRAAFDRLSELREAPDDHNRNYSDGALRIFVEDLSDNELHGLKFGMLPAEPFGDLEPALAGGDVSRMMELAEEAR